MDIRVENFFVVKGTPNVAITTRVFFVVPKNRQMVLLSTYRGPFLCKELIPVVIGYGERGLVIRGRENIEKGVFNESVLERQSVVGMKVHLRSSVSLRESGGCAFH